MPVPEIGGTLAGKYIIERVLGVGGMGVVVAARHIELDQKVAIKYLLPETLANPEIVERFAREARAAAKIRGEHVARVLDVGKFDDGAPFMVLEYLEGEDLSHLLDRCGPLPIADAVGYVLEACEALAEAHAAGIVHRDLKPANLFLAKRPDRRSIVKVLDFGISKVADTASQALTQTAAVMGTPHYMSPEQLIASKHVDARSDIWALGVILFELLSNRKPFDGDTLAEIIGAILNNEPERLSSLRPEVTLDLEFAIARCMQNKPHERHASVKEFAVALAPFASQGQQETVEKIARVLGASLLPTAGAEGQRSQPRLSLELLSSAAASEGADRTGIVGAMAAPQSVAMTNLTSPVAPAAFAEAPVQAFPNARPAAESPPRKRRAQMLMGIASLATVSAAFVIATRVALRAPDARSSVGLVASAQPLLSAVVPPAVVAENADAVVTTPPPAVSAAPPAPFLASSPRASAQRRGKHDAGIVASASPPASASPALAPDKNPLQMGLK